MLAVTTDLGDLAGLRIDIHFQAAAAGAKATKGEMGWHRFNAIGG
jgi:hypothetical protein